MNFERLEPKFDVGYDSDGEAPPATTVEDFEEPAINERLSDGTRIAPNGEDDPLEIGDTPPVDDNYFILRVLGI